MARCPKTEVLALPPDISGGGGAGNRRSLPRSRRNLVCFGSSSPLLCSASTKPLRSRWCLASAYGALVLPWRRVHASLGWRSASTSHRGAPRPRCYHARPPRPASSTQALRFGPYPHRALPDYRGGRVWDLSPCALMHRGHLCLPREPSRPAAYGGRNPYRVQRLLLARHHLHRSRRCRKISLRCRIC